MPARHKDDAIAWCYEADVTYKDADCVDVASAASVDDGVDSVCRCWSPLSDIGLTDWKKRDNVSRSGKWRTGQLEPNSKAGRRVVRAISICRDSLNIERARTCLRSAFDPKKVASWSQTRTNLVGNRFCDLDSVMEFGSNCPVRHFPDLETLSICSERELTFKFAICYRPSVCLSSVCLSVCRL